jgi:serine protease Do
MTSRKHSIFFLVIVLLLTLSIISCSILAPINKGIGQITRLVSTSSPTPTPVPTLDPNVTDALEELQQAFSSVYARVLPSVVNIRVEQTISRGIIPDPDQFPFNFPFPFEIPDQGRELRRSSLGSGFVWDEEGHIVTNYHVVDNADRIVVTFHDGSSLEGTTIGTDPDSDLAVIEVDYPKDPPPPIELADSTQVKVGQMVAAIGNPFGLEGTMTVGVISAVGRSLPVRGQALPGSTYTIPDVIQTDAPINPGNSGGVLVDIHGRLLGVPTAIESSSGSNAGIGFVVPSIIVSKVVPALIEKGSYEHPWIGISGTTLTSEMAEAMDLPGDQHGVLVVEVVPDGPAEEAGLVGSDRLQVDNGRETRLGGDVIIAIDSQPVQDFEDLTAYLARYTEAGQKVTLTILRNKQQRDVELRLGVRPRRQSAVASGNRQEHGRAWLGIQGMTLTPSIASAMDLPSDQTGILIQQIFEDGPADEAGLRGSYKSATIDGRAVLIGGDVIVEVDNKAVTSVDDLEEALLAYEPGEVITFSILRDGDQIAVEVTLGETP